ncbi:helix-turn-helix domain-containing protein [Nocardiopsis sp. CNR-923]|uniref:winged helix-turn-helix transcriptional regulator n=1 Tax=Nocardiopsis sp. CNR-923 TaxID=1904965 RepID=UPI000AA68687|nr:helix-turn-helix domain-containing protein [Nocardiopsis sp. CNR-923]
MLVIVELAGGPRRFRELQRAVDGISQRMLTLTVRRLERDGLVLRTVYPTVPAQVDYRLTGTGASLTHLVKALAEWSLAHRDGIVQARQEYDRAHPGHGIR